MEIKGFLIAAALAARGVNDVSAGGGRCGRRRGGGWLGVGAVAAVIGREGLR
jgi:hypothetical protein